MFLWKRGVAGNGQFGQLSKRVLTELVSLQQSIDRERVRKTLVDAEVVETGRGERMQRMKEEREEIEGAGSWSCGRL